MQDIKNFKSDLPRNKKQILLANKHNIQFLYSADGQDWYSCQSLFSADTIKLTYDDSGIIRSLDRDVSRLWPDGLSVAEVPDTAENRAADISGGWVYSDGVIKPREYSAAELAQQVEQQKSRLLAEAESVIAPLERAVRLGLATDAETERLGQWERYSILVYRVDTANPEYPAKPD